MDWYYADESNRQHSANGTDLDGLVRSGAVKAGTLVWNETFPDWRPAVEVRPELFGIAASPPVLSATQRREVGLGGAGAMQRSPTDSVAICALVFGCLGILTCFPLFALAGVVCGHIARKRAKEESLPSNNGGIALGGLITGYMGVAIFAAMVLIYGIAIFAAFSGAMEGFEPQ